MRRGILESISRLFNNSKTITSYVYKIIGPYNEVFFRVFGSESFFFLHRCSVSRVSLSSNNTTDASWVFVSESVGRQKQYAPSLGHAFSRLCEGHGLCRRGFPCSLFQTWANTVSFSFFLLISITFIYPHVSKVVWRTGDVLLFSSLLFHSWGKSWNVTIFHYLGFFMIKWRSFIFYLPFLLFLIKFFFFSCRLFLIFIIVFRELICFHDYFSFLLLNGTVYFNPFSIVLRFIFLH